jgi:two-component system nitrate/nitrite response regulator NarL
MRDAAQAERQAWISTGLMPLYVCLVVDDDTIADRLVSVVERSGRHRISVLHDIADLQQSTIAPDAILIGVQQFAALCENEPLVYLRLSRRSRIVVVLSSRELLGAAHILAFADSWVFQDINADRINELIDLGLEGHCLMPKQFLSRLGVDEIRLTLLPRLSAVEFQTLLLLGQGLNNRSIADQLDLSEAVIKLMVRSVLWKLHCRNRTEAAVFAARQRSEIMGSWNPSGSLRLIDAARA